MHVCVCVCGEYKNGKGINERTHTALHTFLSSLAAVVMAGHGKSIGSKTSDSFAEEVFILLPRTDYLKFTALAEENNRLRKQLEHHLKYKPIPPRAIDETQSSLKEDSQPVSGEAQFGEGSSTPLQSLAEQISKTIFQHLQSSSLSTLSQPAGAQDKVGFGSTDLTQEYPEPLPSPKFDKDAIPIDPAANSTIQNINQMPASSSDFERTKNSINEKLFNLVSPHLRPKAQLLLHKLSEFSSELEFKENGEIKIDGQTLPDANIYTLFPLLFKPSSYAQNPHLQTLVNEIATLGLGHLISRFYSAGLSPKGQNHIPNRMQLRKEIKTLGPYWYKLNYE